MAHSNKYEVILLGDDSKSSLIRALTNEHGPKIETHHSSTFYTIDVETWNRSVMRVKINDHNDNGWKKGQCYKGVSAAYIVFDPSKGLKTAKADVQYFVQDINRYSNGIKIYLISNTSTPGVEYEDIKDFCFSSGFEMLESNLNFGNNSPVQFREVFFKSFGSMISDEVFEVKQQIPNEPLESCSSTSGSGNTEKLKNSGGSNRNSKTINILQIIPGSGNGANSASLEENFYIVFRIPKLFNLIYSFIPVIYQELGLKSCKYSNTSLSWIVNNRHFILLKDKLLNDDSFLFSVRTCLDLYKVNKNLELAKTITSKYHDTLISSASNEKALTENICSIHGNIEIVRYIYGQEFKFNIHCLYNAIICGDLDIIKFLMKHCKLFSQNQHQELAEMNKCLDLAKEYKRPEIRSYVSKHCSTKTKSISLLFSNLKKKISGNSKDKSHLSDLNTSTESL